MAATQTATFGAAVPQPVVKTAVDKEYDQYKNCFELDVFNTIDKDLEDEATDEKIREVQHQSGYETAQRKAMIKEDVDKIQKMLTLYFFGPPTVTNQ